ncbi:MAG: hypothetical protein DRI90_24905, partial [Deltaproteobacteria bacterium]
MSFWKRLFGGRKEAEGDPESATAEVPEPIDEEAKAPAAQAAAAAQDAEGQLEQLRRIGRPGGAEVDAALALLRHHQGNARQTKVLHAILEGLAALGLGSLGLGSPGSGSGPSAPPADRTLDALLVACAHLLEARGQEREARELVATSRSVAGMLLAADLHAAAGLLPQAVSTIERVLARSIDTPGARERHDRWLAQLGRRSHSEVADDGATVVAPAVQETSFRILREVARGGAGTVYEAEDELLSRRLAFKVYHRAGDDHDQIAREGRTAVLLRGPGV